MASVNVKNEENVEISIKRFRKEVEKESILKELKDRQYHVKPSTQKKLDRKKLEKRLKRKERKRRAQMGF
ncbi:MAG TPA: 30S ribosomal protein S21 [Spirochaetota bacterium]|nr:30S ribosomal protein S21 [Spirochaetota bacterium]